MRTEVAKGEVLKFSPFAASVPNVDNRSQKFLQLDLKPVNFLLNKLVTFQAIPEFDAVILHYMYPAIMTMQEYSDDSDATLCKVADVYDKHMTHGILTKGENPSIAQGSGRYWAQKAQTDSPDIKFQAKLLLSIQNGANISSTINQSVFNREEKNQKSKTLK